MDSEQAYRRFKMAQKAQMGTGINTSTSISTEMDTSFAIHQTNTATTSTSTADSSINISFPNSPSPSIIGNLPTDLSVMTTSVADKEALASAKNIPTPADLSLLYGNTTLPMEILQQIQKQHQQLYRQSVVAAAAAATVAAAAAASTSDAMQSTNASDAEPMDIENLENLEDGIPKSFIQNAGYNQERSVATYEDLEMILRTYFTDSCIKQQAQHKPLNLKSETTNASKSSSFLDCFITNNEPHLHCLIKGCDEIISKTLADISEHMRLHEFTRGTAESLIQSSNLMQITSVDGFFNRKRGRPPKNRVVEVYNNVSSFSISVQLQFNLYFNFTEST